MSRAIRFAPLVLLLIVTVALIWRLATPVNSTVSSKLEGKPLPAYALPAVVAKPGLASQDLRTGTPRILNIFASWCVPCVAEVKVLQALQRRGVHVDGIAIRCSLIDRAGWNRRLCMPWSGRELACCNCRSSVTSAAG